MKRYGGDMENTPVFNAYISNLCTEKNILIEHVISKTDISRTYARQLFNGLRKPTRDRVIQLAFGFEMDYDETQKLLSVARKSLLSPRIKRDTVIIYSIKEKHTINKVQNLLYEIGLPILGEAR